MDRMPLTPDEEPKSRTRLKKEVEELQKLGEQLVELPSSYLGKSGIPPELLDAVLTAKSIHAHGARRRQMQRIGVIMREVDGAQIRRVLHAFGQEKYERGSPSIEDPYESVSKLINGSDAQVEDLMERYPHADRTRLRSLVRNARKEASQEGHSRAMNALKSYLLEIMR
jgi:ribosome-associated protein